MSKEYIMDQLFNGFMTLKDGSIKANEELGKGEARQISFGNDFGLFNMNFILYQDLHLYEQVDMNLSSFCTVAKGEMNHEDFANGVKSKYMANKTQFISSSKKRSVSLFEKDKEIDLYFFYLNKDFILPFLQNSQNEELQLLAKKWQNEEIYSVKTLNINAEDVQKLYRFKNFGFNDSLEKLYLTSTAYELLYSWLKNYEDDKLPEEEVRYILLAQEYILDNLDKNFNLKTLAKIAKTNEKKFQQNFKTHFKQNPFEYILSKKLQHAKNLLATKEYTVNEIAKKVGYKHQSNFSIAFFKHFGFSPKELSKKIL